MIAIDLPQFGDASVLRVADRPKPRVADGEVLIRIEAAGVNRPDIMQRQGKYPPPPGASDIPGLEVAGEIAEVASDVTRWRAGDRVCALLAGGGYAEYCTAPAVQCLPIPQGIDSVTAAAVPETFFTVWSNVFERGGLRAGETILIHGGTSGIGTTAIQLATAHGATVYATAGSDEKCEACVRLGAAAAINYRTHDFVAEIQRLTDGRGVDEVLDIIGGEYLPRNIQCLALDGRLVQIGLIGGSRAQIDLRAVLQKRLTLTGSTLRARPIAEKGRLAAEVERHVWPLLTSGAARPIVHRTFPLTQVAEAHRLLESGDVIGKLVLVVARSTH